MQSINRMNILINHKNNKFVMKLKIDLITIVTDNMDELIKFYQGILGFEVKLQLENYVEFNNKGIMNSLQ